MRLTRSDHLTARRRAQQLSDRQLAFLIFVGAILVFGSMFYIFRYEKVKNVEIMDRWWESATYVRYRERYWSTETQISTQCTGFGESQRCTTYTDVVPVRKTRTVTRCTSNATGRDFPAQMPEPSCVPRANDFISHWAAYRVSYREEETSDKITAIIQPPQWDGLAPGQRVQMTVGLLGDVRDFKNK